MNTHTLCFTHLKGGSGSTLLAINFAALLAQENPQHVAFLQVENIGDYHCFLQDAPKSSLEDCKAFITQKELTPDNLKTLMQKEQNFYSIGCKDLKESHLTNDDLIKILQTLKASFRFIVIDCHFQSMLNTPCFELSDALVYCSYTDIASVHTFHMFQERIQKTGMHKKVFPVVNQMPKHMSTKEAEKLLGSSVLTTLPTDTNAAIESMAFGKMFVQQSQFPLTIALKKLQQKLFSLI